MSDYRLDVGITAQGKENIEELQERTGLTTTQLVRRAFALLDMMAELEDEGAKIIVRHADGEEEDWRDPLLLDKAEFQFVRAVAAAKEVHPFSCHHRGVRDVTLPPEPRRVPWRTTK